MHKTKFRLAGACLVLAIFLTAPVCAFATTAPPATQIARSSASSRTSSLAGPILKPDQGPAKLIDRLASRGTEVGLELPSLVAPGLFSIPIIQQPLGRNNFVSGRSDRITQFGLAMQHGVTGLLAHNFLAGRAFYGLQIGTPIWIARSKDKVQMYKVASVELFQRITLPGEADRYIQLVNHREWTTSELFAHFYADRGRLVLQTCLARFGRLNWGLYFVVAEPIN